MKQHMKHYIITIYTKPKYTLYSIARVNTQNIIDVFCSLLSALMFTPTLYAFTLFSRLDTSFLLIGECTK